MQKQFTVEKVGQNSKFGAVSLKKWNKNSDNEKGEMRITPEQQMRVKVAGLKCK